MRGKSRLVAAAAADASVDTNRKHKFTPDLGDLITYDVINDCVRKTFE